LRKENSQKEQTQSLQSISFDGEERQRLARQDREIYMPGIETRRANVPQLNSDFKSSLPSTDLLIALFSNADLSTRVGGLLLSVVAENRKPCPPMKKKDIKSDQRETRARNSDVFPLEHSANRFFST